MIRGIAILVAMEQRGFRRRGSMRLLVKGCALPMRIPRPLFACLPGKQFSVGLTFFMQGGTRSTPRLEVRHRRPGLTLVMKRQRPLQEPLQRRAEPPRLAGRHLHTSVGFGTGRPLENGAACRALPRLSWSISTRNCSMSAACWRISVISAARSSLAKSDSPMACTVVRPDRQGKRRR